MHGESAREQDGERDETVREGRVKGKVTMQKGEGAICPLVLLNGGSFVHLVSERVGIRCPIHRWVVHAIVNLRTRTGMRRCLTYVEALGGHGEISGMGASSPYCQMGIVGSPQIRTWNSLAK